jgi:hypothetical protein
MEFVLLLKSAALMDKFGVKDLVFVHAHKNNGIMELIVKIFQNV